MNLYVIVLPWCYPDPPLEFEGNGRCSGLCTSPQRCLDKTLQLPLPLKFLATCVIPDVLEELTWLTLISYFILINAVSVLLSETLFSVKETLLINDYIAVIMTVSQHCPNLAFLLLCTQMKSTVISQQSSSSILITNSEDRPSPGATFWCCW